MRETIGRRVGDDAFQELAARVQAKHVPAPPLEPVPTSIVFELPKQWLFNRTAFLTDRELRDVKDLPKLIEARVFRNPALVDTVDNVLRASLQRSRTLWPEERNYRAVAWIRRDGTVAVSVTVLHGNPPIRICAERALSSDAIARGELRPGGPGGQTIAAMALHENPADIAIWPPAGFGATVTHMLPQLKALPRRVRIVAADASAAIFTDRFYPATAFPPFPGFEVRPVTSRPGAKEMPTVFRLPRGLSLKPRDQDNLPIIRAILEKLKEIYPNTTALPKGAKSPHGHISPRRAHASAVICGDLAFLAVNGRYSNSPHDVDCSERHALANFVNTMVSSPTPLTGSLPYLNALVLYSDDYSTPDGKNYAARICGNCRETLDQFLDPKRPDMLVVFACPGLDGVPMIEYMGKLSDIHRETSTVAMRREKRH